MGETDKDDIDSFLRKVNEIESIMKGLTSSNAEESKSSLEKADEYLLNHGDGLSNPTVKKKKDGVTTTRTVVNKTIINDKAFKEDDKNISQEAFMKSMEEDCRERTERRKKNKEEAEEIKERADKEFNKGNYQKSVELYNEAVNKVRDWTTLYTNRAQAHVQLGNFQAALDDCSWAFRVDENCLNALVVQGKTYYAMKDYDKAIESYEKALKIKPKKETILREYINQVKAIQDDARQQSTKNISGDSGEYKMKSVSESSLQR